MRSPTDYLSARALAVDASGIRRVFDLAAKMKDPINLSIGLPDFDVPEGVKTAAMEAIRRGDNRYTQTQGIAPLRERLRKVLSAEVGRDVGEVLVTSGVSGGLFLAILATIDPGDEAVCLDPYFVMYKHLMTMAGGKLNPGDSYPDFRFHAQRVERAITPRTKFLILNSPSNPTGAVMSEAEIRAAVDVARKHDLLILSDEIYEPFLYDVDRAAGQLYSPGSIYDRTIILRGFSKSHAMTGWRLGYATGPAEGIAQMPQLQPYTFGCAPSPPQYRALKGMGGPTNGAGPANPRKRRTALDGPPQKSEPVKPP